MADVFTKSKRSEVMARIRSRGNRATELALAKLLRAHGLAGWRRQLEVKGGKVQGSRKRRSGGSADRRHSQIPSARLRRSAETPPRSRVFRVRPDFVFPKLRLAVFVDGCFWHACPLHATQPRNHAAFWRRKLAANQARDRRVNRALRAAGWRVLRLWEHEPARSRKARLVAKLRKALGAAARF